jgi:hypothetical protein
MVPLNAKDEKGQPLKVHDNVPPLTWNGMSQVFPADGFVELFDRYKASFLQGGAHVFNTTYQVGTCKPPSCQVCLMVSLATCWVVLQEHMFSKVQEQAKLCSTLLRRMHAWRECHHGTGIVPGVF